ncbi:hypothetical protein F2Q69_00024683 [Brassica cretica]|uniref:RNase H type-1 domain-containing protein n=1 Tax=Brassica cretica TaxID=69181 RepID=A0A8S9QAG5_BRACR|nr:hypothetical protein F2Q69_00024683 [Brassica cretica]
MNTLIFEKRQTPAIETATKAIKLAKEWNMAQQDSSSQKEKKAVLGGETNPPESQPRQESQPRHSNEETINSLHNLDLPISTCKSDAAWDAITKRAGTAWIFSGPQHLPSFSGTKVETYVDSALIAEALAMRSAITEAISMGLTHLRALSDNQTLVRVINNKRSENGHADLLAKATLRNSSLVDVNGGDTHGCSKRRRDWHGFLETESRWKYSSSQKEKKAVLGGETNPPESQPRQESQPRHSNEETINSLHNLDLPISTCKSDAAWDAITKRAGTAWIFSGPQHLPSFSGTKVETYVDSALIAEALAMRSAITEAISMGLTHLRALSDNQTLVRAINNKRSHKEIYGILQDIKNLSSSFVSFSYFFLLKTENGHTDLLAKATLRNPSLVDVNGGDTHTAAPSEDGIGMAFWRRNQDGNVIDQHYFH